MSALPRQRATRPIGWLIAVGIAALAPLIVWIAMHKFIAMDEFQYAHAAWLFAQGAVPYTDFFDHHFPLLYQLLAPLFWLMGDAPERVIWLRYVMLVVLAGTAMAVAAVNRHERRFGAGFAALALLGCGPYVMRATEIRPDPLAFALFLGAIAALYPRRWSPRRRGWLSGLLLTAAVWTSQKLLVYGATFVVFFVLDLFRLRAADTRFATGDPRAFAVGSAIALVPIAGYLFATGSFGAWLEWCLLWPMRHEQGFEGFSWTQYFNPVARSYFWLFPLAAAGALRTVLRRRRAGDWTHPDALLLAALPLTFASYAMQKAPYSYSLLPFLGMLCVFAGRGMAWALSRIAATPALTPARCTGALAAAALFVAAVAWSGRPLLGLSADRNTYQLDVLTELGAMTAPDDVVYDNSGIYVSRPHAYWYYYTSSFIRQTERARLLAEVPAAIRATDTTVYVNDSRVHYLDPELQRFIVGRFVRVYGDIWLWGQRYPTRDGRIDAHFEANRDGQYYVYPREALERGALRIDGRAIDAPVFELAEGVHRVEYAGDAPGLAIVWLPRNGRTYPALPPERSRMSRL